MSTLSLARGAPTADLLPAEDVRRAAHTVLEADPAGILSYGSALGYPPLRRVLAARHGVNPDHILVTNGSLQLFAFTMEHLARSTAGAVAIEAPTYDRSLKNLRDRGIATLTVPMEADGMRVDALDSADPFALLYTVPNFANPAGATLSPAKREHVARLARERGFLVYEDDPYRLLRFSGKDLPTIQSLAPEACLWATSFTKTLAPGLRVGYALVPETLREPLQALATDTYISPSLLPQAIVAHLLETGVVQRRLPALRAALAERLDRLCAALDAYLPEASYVRPDGGYFLWLSLPPGVDADALAAAAAERDLQIVAGTAFMRDGGQDAVRLAFSGLQADQIEQAVKRLADAAYAVRTPESR